MHVSESQIVLLDRLSFGCMCLSLVVVAVIILGSMYKARQTMARPGGVRHA